LNILQTLTTCNLIKIKDIPAKYPEGEGGGGTKKTRSEASPQQMLQLTIKSPQLTSETLRKDTKRTLSSTQFVRIHLHLAQMRFTIEK